MSTSGWAKPLAAVVGGACAIYFVASGSFSGNGGVPPPVEVNSASHTKALSVVGGGADSATVAALTAQIATLTSSLDGLRAQMHAQTATCAQAVVQGGGTPAVAPSPCPAAAAAPATPPASSGAALVDAHGLAYWRQTAYTMAPFVWPQLYACPKAANEVPAAAGE